MPYFNASGIPLRNPGMIEAMIGPRIKARLADLGENVKWLAQKSGVPTSTLYELMNGRMKTTTRAAVIAQALGVSAVWLETGHGSATADVDPPKPAPVAWPFSFDPERFVALSSDDRELVESAALGMLEQIEKRRGSQAKKGRRSG